MFDKLKCEHNGYKRSSLTLPFVKRDDDLKDRGSDGHNKSRREKLPDISNQSSPNTNIDLKKARDSALKESNGSNNGNKSHRKGVVKRLVNGRRDTKSIVDHIDNTANGAIEKKPTPEGTIQRLTGGIELVPLLARGRRVGARTLPSSDVTRPPEQTCQ